MLNFSDNDIVYFLENIECCGSSWYNIITSDEFFAHWFLYTIPLAHTVESKCKCFGYVFKFGFKTTYYIGDISCFKELPINSEFFLDTSIYSLEVENLIGLLDSFDKQHLIYITVSPEKKKEAKKLVKNICNVYIV